VFTTRYSGGRGGRNGLEHELRRLGVTQKNGKPNHPQTQGKVERLWYPGSAADGHMSSADSPVDLQEGVRGW
jgi:transposase InsO family protein